MSPRRTTTKAKSAAEVLPVAAFAKRVGRTRQAVMRAIEEGRLTGESAWKNDRGWWVVHVERGTRDLEAGPAPAGRRPAARRESARRRAAGEPDPAAEPPPASAEPAAEDEPLGLAAEDLSIGAGLVPTGPDGKPLKKVQVQTAREAVLTHLALLELEKERGSLVSAAEVSDVLAELGRATLDGLLALPARVAPGVLACTEVVEVEVIIEQAILHALRKLARAGQAGDTNGPGHRDGATRRSE